MHWAAYLNREISLCYLLAWGGNPNSEDFEGNTPLHLSVMQNNDHGEQTRCIRILLLKGAERGVKNAKGEIPADKIAEDSLMGDELRKILVRIFISLDRKSLSI